MAMRNLLYEGLKLQRPNRDRVAAAMFGQRTVKLPMPDRAANANAFFANAHDASAAIERGRGYTDYPQWLIGGGGTGLSGAVSDFEGGGLGSLPKATVYIPINHPGPPWDVGDAVFCIGRHWGKVDGLCDGNIRVPNFDARYKKAQAISAAADNFKVGTPIQNMVRQFDDRMADALKRVLRHYQWDVLCGFGSDPEGAIWDNCRSKAQVDALKTALADTNTALKNYDQLELAMVKAPANWRTDYLEPIDYGVESGAAATGQASSGQMAYDMAFGGRNRGSSAAGASTGVSRGASTASGMPSWAFPVAGVALLGILAGGLYFLKKK